MKRGITNIAVHGVDHLADIAKQRLRSCQQQTDLLARFLAQTGTTLAPNRHDDADVSLSISVVLQ